MECVMAFEIPSRPYMGIIEFATSYIVLAAKGGRLLGKYSGYRKLPQHFTIKKAPSGRDKLVFGAPL